MNSKKSKGFTLVETVLAIGVVGVLIVVFVAMFYPARRVVQSALTVQEADKIVNALTNELDVVRKPERASTGTKTSTRKNYVSAFDKAFYWMLSTAKPETTILVYNYRGDTDKPLRDDGSFEPLESDEFVPGKNAVLTTAATLATNEDKWKDLQHAVGPIFAVRMTQLVVKEQRGMMKYVLSPEPGQINDPYNYQGGKITKPEEYFSSPNNKSKGQLAWGAEVVYMAEFFQVNARDPRSLKGMTWTQLKKPVFSRNLVFRR